MNKIIR